MFGFVSRDFFLPTDTRKHSADVRLWFCSCSWRRGAAEILSSYYLISALLSGKRNSSRSSQIKRHEEKKDEERGEKDQTMVSELMK
jgi:hypothetical protein